MNVQSLHFMIDLSHDGSYSMWELWEAVKFVYRLPGNLAVEGLGHIPYLSDALNIHASATAGYDSFNGLLATGLSLLVWIAVLFTLLTLASPEEETDDPVVTQHMANVHPLRSDDARQKPHDTGTGVMPQRPAVSAVQARVHLPVSRPTYAAPGIRARRRLRRHHGVAFLAGHAK